VHAHHHHSHGGSGAASHGARRDDRRRLLVVLVLSSLYMFAEVAGGLLTGSLALLADAGHTLSDVASLLLGLFALWIAQRPATSTRTYGYTRIEILAALVQGAGLVAVAVTIFLEAIERLGQSHAVNGIGMMVVASGALLVNAIGLVVLNPGRSENINIRGVWLHVLSDALGSVGVIAAGGAVWLLGWNWADPAVSMLISVLVLFAAVQLVRDAFHILMEGAPAHLDVEEIRRALIGIPSVENVHDLHVWTIGNGEVSLSSHVVAPAGGDRPSLLQEVRELLRNRFEIHHATVQIEVHDPLDPECAGACDPPEDAEDVRSASGGPRDGS
jgi:cobalt-zinc-cadmium efflux system protein